MKSYNIENTRQAIQKNLDDEKKLKERNELGQFSTPYNLAIEIVKISELLLCKNEKIKFLDPAIGTGVFYSALVNHFGQKRIIKAKGFEVDDHYGIPSKEIWGKSNLEYSINDFTLATFPSDETSKYNLIICNPPYVRHHHINGQKVFLQKLAEEYSGIKLSTLSGLYCYFLAICHKWMVNNGIAIWLIPSEFMDVNYGKAIKEYLTTKVSLLQIHRFDPDDLQFSDALVTTSIVIFKNTKPKSTLKAKFSFGTNLLKPEIQKEILVDDLKNEKKWTRFPQKEINNNRDIPKLKDYFQIKRGIATGDNSFFILSKEEVIKKKIPFTFFKPILPSPRYVSERIIESDNLGNPILEKQLFVLDCKESITTIEKEYPKLFAYLKEGIERKVTERYICRNRKLWYSQENREISNFLFTYIGRGNDSTNTFRFILNKSKAIVSNSFLMLYPNNELQLVIKGNDYKKEELLELLNEITQSEFLEHGRVYGGGMRKFEPKELAQANSTKIRDFIKKNTA